MRGLVVTTLIPGLSRGLCVGAILVGRSRHTSVLTALVVGISFSLRDLSSGIVGLTRVGTGGFCRLCPIFRDDSSHHRFQRFFGGSERLGFREGAGGVHLGGESGLGLVGWVTGVEALDTMAVLVPCLADAKMLGIGLIVS